MPNDGIWSNGINFEMSAPICLYTFDIWVEPNATNLFMKYAFDNLR